MDQLDEREQFVVDTFKAEPKTGINKVRKMLVEKFGKGFEFYKVKGLKKLALGKAHRNKVKKELKKGTTPLKAQVKQLGKALVENGIDEAVMKVIDGVPHWHIVERRSYDIS